METCKAIINYLTDHWSQITTFAAVVIAHGGIKTIGLSIWNGNKTKPSTPPQDEAQQPKSQT